MKSLLMALILAALVSKSYSAEVCTGEIILQKEAIKKEALEIIKSRDLFNQEGLAIKLAGLGAQLDSLVYNNRVGVCIENGRNLDLGKFVGEVGQLINLQDLTIFREEAIKFRFDSAEVRNYRLPSGINSQIEFHQQRRS